MVTKVQSQSQPVWRGPMGDRLGEYKGSPNGVLTAFVKQEPPEFSLFQSERGSISAPVTKQRGREYASQLHFLINSTVPSVSEPEEMLQFDKNKEAESNPDAMDCENVKLDYRRFSSEEDVEFKSVVALAISKIFDELPRIRQVNNKTPEQIFGIDREPPVVPYGSRDQDAIMKEWVVKHGFQPV